MNAPAPAGVRAHAPGPPLLGQTVFEQSYPASGPGWAPGRVGGWWAFFTCGCCHEQRYEPLACLPADATAETLARHATEFWAQPCVLLPFHDGFAVYPAGGES
ncbi:hypothetical protein [Streptomyces sp. NPDC047981]|uniref:hypothetical protein n=1 Tax=Streptomyces sp. NPDC047981 TaxID=3154610 RepID=UPI0034283A3F